MIQLSEDDVVKGLKRLKSLAKQDILASALAPDPKFWAEYASARKEEYEGLIELVNENGVEEAFSIASEEYEELKRAQAQGEGEEKTNSPVLKGRLAALELFFKMLGADGSSREIDIGEPRRAVQ